MQASEAFQVVKGLCNIYILSH